MTGDRERGRVLWVTEEVPDRDLGGGSIRQAHLLGALAREIPTDLLVVGRVSDEAVRASASRVIELPPRKAIWTQHPLGRRALQLAHALGSPNPAQAYFSGPGRRALARALGHYPERFDLAIVQHEALASLLPYRSSIPWVIELHHLFSAMASQQLRLARGGRWRWWWEWERRKARRFERRILERADRVIVCSEEDADQLRGIAEPVAAGIRVIPNGVDMNRFPVTAVPSEPRILFPGTLGYLPNVDGARWFCAEVFPRIRAAVPRATIQVVGRDAVPEVLALARLPGVAVHADVPAMTPYFEAARLVVVPLRVGTGTRLKALEAMAAARPVLGTSTGLEGIGIVDGEHARVVDDPGPMADAAIALLRDDALARRLADAGRRHVEEHFEWERIGAKLVAVVSELLGTRELKGAMPGA